LTLAGLIYTHLRGAALLFDHQSLRIGSRKGRSPLIPHPIYPSLRKQSHRNASDLHTYRESEKQGDKDRIE
jgi:hypothetical protein